MTQLPFIPKTRREHGGMLALHKRRSRRSLDTKKPVHLVLRSELARGHRSLLNHRPLIDHILKKYSRRFRIRVYEFAICGNHIHCLLKGQTRKELQYFFRVFAGQIAQEILRVHPLGPGEEKAFWGGTPRGLRIESGSGTLHRSKKNQIAHPKNQRTFWSLVIYSRVVSWGREYLVVKAYVVQNHKEALGIIPYRERRRARIRARFSSA